MSNLNFWNLCHLVKLNVQDIQLSFGNLTTNIRNADAGSDPQVDDQSVPRFDTYGDAPADTLFVLSGSDGYLEVALRCASAAARLGKDDGSTVSLQHL